MDWIGDGLIQTRDDSLIPVDAPTAAKPYPFWINHDQDDLETGGETWPIARPDCTRRYPLDTDAAAAQLGDDYRASIGRVNETSFRMRLSRLGAPDLDGSGYCLLFDVGRTGRDALVATILVDGAPVAASTPLHMDLAIRSWGRGVC